MGRRFFWVILVMNLFCFSPFCFAQTVYTSQYTYISQPYPKVLITLTPTDYPSPALQQDPFLLENAFQSFITQNFPPVSPSGPPFTREIFLNYFTGMSNNIAYSTDYGVNTFWTIPNEATLSTPMTWTLKQYRPGYDYTTNTPTSVFEEYASFSFTVVLVKTSKGIYAQISDSLGNSSFVPSPAEFEVSGVELKAGAADNAAERYGQWYETGTIQVGSSESQQEKSYELRELVMKPVIEQVDAQGNQSNTTIFSPQLGQKLEFTPSFVGLGINPWTPTPVQWELDILDSSGEVIFADVGSGISPIAWDGTMNTVAPASSGSGPLVASAGTYTYEMYGYTAEGTFAAAGGTVQVGNGLKVNVSASPTALRPSYFNTNNTTSTISVTVTDAQGNPLTKPQLLKFKIFVPSIPSTPVQSDLILVGGHAHLGNRPLGLFETTQGETPLSHFSCGTVFPQPLNFKGYEYKSLQGDSSDSCEFEGETNSQGDLTLTYFSPPVGGQVNLKVTPVNQTLAPGSQNQAQILMRVPGLELLPDDSILYTKTGGTYDHPGPCPPEYSDVPSECDSETNYVIGYPGIDTDHYGVPVFDQDIVQIVNDFKNGVTIKGKTYSGFPNETFLINDMSLPLGGLFDYTGDWVPPHIYHDLGLSCDINLANEPLNSSMNLGPEAKLLKRIIHRYHLHILQEGTHWHIYLPGGGPPK